MSIPFFHLTLVLSLDLEGANLMINEFSEEKKWWPGVKPGRDEDKT